MNPDLQYYTRAGLLALLDAATVLYRRKGQRRAAKNAQFRVVRELRAAVKEAT